MLWGGLGTASYFLYRNSHSTTDQNTALNVSFPTLEPFSLPQTLNPSERMWSTEEGYEVTTQHNVNKSVLLGRLHRHIRPTSEPIGNNRTASSDSNQSSIEPSQEWSKRAQPAERAQKNNALEELRNYYANRIPAFISLPNNLPPALAVFNINNDSMATLPEE